MKYTENFITTESELTSLFFLFSGTHESPQQTVSLNPAWAASGTLVLLHNMFSLGQ
jgi:hypothetical protein